MSMPRCCAGAPFTFFFFGRGTSMPMRRPRNMSIMSSRCGAQRVPFGSTGSPSTTRHIGWFSASAVKYCAVRSPDVSIIVNCSARVRGVLHASYSSAPDFVSGGLQAACVRTPMVW